ncbi:hypothetical protein KAR91_77805 [Candidatus Pacearchaeota archaeon]|nr:hypothetical protein [Candidatus Pacearchaeota archaeon]
MNNKEATFHVEGDILQLIDPATDIRIFVEVTEREQANIDYIWSEYVAAGADSGPEEITDIEPDDDKRELYQGIYGPREDVLLYKSLPSNVRLGGFRKIPKATSANRRVGYVDNVRSPYDNPDFETEFFLRGNTRLDALNLDAFNNSGVNIRPRVRFLVNKMLIREISEERNPGLLSKLKAGLVPFRPVTLGGLPSTRGEVSKE